LEPTVTRSCRLYQCQLVGYMREERMTTAVSEEGFALCPSSAAGVFRRDARREGSVGPEAPVGVAEGLFNDCEPR
jgi:hypothetical protein